MTKFLKSDLGPAWIGLAVVLLGALLFAIRLNAMFLFWAFVVGALVMIGSVVLVVKTARPSGRASSGNDAGSSWKPSEAEHFPFDPGPSYGPNTNLPNHFN
jgi:hypothetical protein